jgi:hypothetical protein
MTSKELRCGNIITHLGDKIIVDSSVIAKIEEIERESGFESTLYWGIPVDEQWLDKMGFYKTFNGNKGDGIGCYTFDKIEIALSHNGFYAFDEVGHLTKGLKYVHQLQNLIYILTGTELTIKD